MKKSFMTGLALILPLAITILLLDFILDLITKPFVGPVSHLLNTFHILDQPFLVFTGPQVVYFSSRFIALIILILLILFLGIIGHHFFYRYILRMTNSIFHRIPFVNKIYKACHDVIMTLCNKDKPAFSQVVMVPFPHENVLTVGLITRDKISHTTAENAENTLVSVFIPATPNPTFGFMLLFKKEQLIPVNITVQQALTFIVSAGAILPKVKT